MGNKNHIGFGIGKHLSKDLKRRRWIDRINSPPSDAPQPEFVFEKRVDQRDGQEKLYFPFMSISDLHIGTRHFRASRTSHMLHNTMSDRLVAVGDIVDLEYMREKSSWNFAPWHRQVLAHLIRRKAEYFPGNHDHDARGQFIVRDGVRSARRLWLGKQIYGVKIENEGLTTDPKGRTIKILHGDVYDDIVFGSSKSFAYGVGDFFLTPIAHFETTVRSFRRFEKFSIAAPVKRATKTFINRFLGVEKEIVRSIDADPKINGLLYGHSHIGGIRKTSQGKIIINDGTCTEHSQAVVRDKNGTYALITCHKDGFAVEEENGSKYPRTLKQLGVPAFMNPPMAIEDEFTHEADRLIRVIYRLAPPKDRQRAMRRRRTAETQGQSLLALPKNIALPPHPHREQQAKRRQKTSFNPAIMAPSP